MTSQEHIQIVVAADKHYFVPLYVMLFSLLENRKSAHPIVISLISKDFIPSQKDRLNDLVRAYPHASFSYLQLEKSAFSHLDQQMPALSEVTYFRLMIPELLGPEVKKVIYLDSDMLVLDDIAQLWEIELSGKACGGVPEHYTFMPNTDSRKAHFMKLGLPSDATYCNGGVLVMNLEVWRKENLGQACINFLKDFPERVTFDDQCALNYVLRGKWYYLPIRWNVTNIWFRFREEIADRPEFQEAMAGAILHYTTASKPWQASCKHPQKALFEKYYEQSPLYEQMAIGVEDKEIREGVSLICVVRDSNFLGKSLVNWSQLSEIDEIILIDGSGEEACYKLVEENSVENIVYVRVANPGEVSDPALINLAIRISRRKKILKVDADCIIHPPFFETHLLAGKCFFYLSWWENLLATKTYQVTCFFAFRKDLMSMQGLHEQLSQLEAAAHLFQRLQLSGLASSLLNSHYMACLDSSRLHLEAFQPFPALAIPILHIGHKDYLFACKSRGLAKLLPWDLLTPFTSYKLNTSSTNTWDAIAYWPKDHPQPPPLDLLKLEKETLIEWINPFGIPEWSGKTGRESLDDTDLSLSFFTPERLEKMTIKKLTQEFQTNEKATLGQVQQELEAVYQSYSWKIGSKLISIVAKTISWFPYIKRRISPK